MLLEVDDVRIEGDQGAVLFEVYAAVVQILEEHGSGRETADAIALQLLPRLQGRLATAGMVVRQVEPGRHRDPYTYPRP
jgi:hypothetical protein